MGEKSGSKSGYGSRMNNPDHISESLTNFFGLKYLNSLMWIGSEMEKIRIRDGKKLGWDPG
jgi:hypothetical protein